MASLDHNARRRALEEIDIKTGKLLSQVSGTSNYGMEEIKKQRAKARKSVREQTRKEQDKYYAEKYPVTPEVAERMREVAEQREKFKEYHRKRKEALISIKKENNLAR